MFIVPPVAKTIVWNHMLTHERVSESALVTFEAFEASPQSEKVLAAEVALQWDFPGVRVFGASIFPIK